MALKPDTKEQLNGFEARMKTVTVGKTIFDYTPTDKVRAMIPDKGILDNIILMVMVFIMDRTLGPDKGCSLASIGDYVEEISSLFSDSYNIDDPHELARFVVVVVLQKNGNLVNTRIYNTDKERMGWINIRLIDEEAGKFRLTADACDYLFRTHEIDDELNYSFTRMMLKENLRRNDYSRALDQSRELVARLRNILIAMDDFDRRCRENIMNETDDQYDHVMNRFQSGLSNEFEELQEILQSARDKKDEIDQAINERVDLEDMIRHRRALGGIIRNIDCAIGVMREMINSRESLKSKYEDYIRNAFTVSHFQRLNFERDIMMKIRDGRLSVRAAYEFIRCPLLKPNFRRIFNIESLYELPVKRTDRTHEEENDIDNILPTADKKKTRNARFQEITNSIFRCMKGKTRFTVSEYIKSLTVSDLVCFCREKALPQVFTELFHEGDISIDEWKNSTEPINEPEGEFTLPQFLENVPDSLLDMNGLRIINTDNECSFSMDMEETRNKIRLTDFIVEVDRT